MICTLRLWWLNIQNKIKMHSNGHRWKLDWLEMPSRRRNVYSILCDCGRCYFSETSRPLEVHIKGHKYNLTQGLLKKLKLDQHAYKEGHKICWKEVKVLWIEPNTTYSKYKESTYISGRASDQSTQLGCLSHLDSHHWSRGQKTTNQSCSDYMEKLCFYVFNS
jgi:hypothetical protein